MWIIIIKLKLLFLVVNNYDEKHIVGTFILWDKVIVLWNMELSTGKNLRI